MKGVLQDRLFAARRLAERVLLADATEKFRFVLLFLQPLARVVIGTERGAHFADIVLDAAEALKLPIVGHDHAVANHASLGIPLDASFGDEATGAGSDLGNLEDLSDLGLADFGLSGFGFEHALEGFFDIVGEVVDDAVEAKLHFSLVGDVAHRGGDVAGGGEEFGDATAEAGYPRTDDVNGYRQEGFAKFDRNVHKGRRLSAAWRTAAPARGGAEGSGLRAAVPPATVAEATVSMLVASGPPLAGRPVDQPEESEHRRYRAAEPVSFWRRRPVLIAGAVLAGLLVLYVAAYVAAGGSLARNATVLGVEVGGLSPAEAEAKHHTNFAKTGRPSSWNLALPILKQAVTEIDEANPRSVDSASKATDALGEARLPGGLEALIDLSQKPVTRKLVSAQVGAIRAIGT